MDIEKMFLLLVNIVLVVLMLTQAVSPLGYLFAIIFVFVQVVLLIMLLSEKFFDVRHFYLLMCIIIGFVYLILYLLMPGQPLSLGLGYLLVAAFFVGTIISSFSQGLRTQKVEVYDSGKLEKPKPPKKNIFEEIEKKEAKKIETNLRKQARKLVAAEKKLQKITKRLQAKPKKKTTKVAKKKVKKPAKKNKTTHKKAKKTKRKK